MTQEEASRVLEWLGIPPIAGGAKVAGIQNTMVVDDAAGAGKDISDSVTGWSLSTPRGAQDITGLTKNAIERLLLLSDGQLTINGIFEATTDAGEATDAHEVFKTIGSDADGSTRTVVLTLALAGGAPVSDDPELTMEMVLTDYSITRGNDGALTYTATLQLANGTAPTWTVKT